MKLGQPVPLSNLLAAVEQRQAAQPAGVDPVPFLIEEQAAKRGLGAMLEQHVPLLIVEIGLQFVQLGICWRGQVERRGVEHVSSFSLATDK